MDLCCQRLGQAFICKLLLRLRKGYHSKEKIPVYLSSPLLLLITIDNIICDGEELGFNNMQLHLRLLSLLFVLFVGDVVLSASVDLVQSTSECSLYLAESTIPNAGMGVFTTVVGSLYISYYISFTLYQSTNKQTYMQITYI